jgi:hypothetical protein
MVPQRAVWKALPGWVMLTRRHAEEVRTACRYYGHNVVFIINITILSSSFSFFFFLHSSYFLLIQLSFFIHFLLHLSFISPWLLLHSPSFSYTPPLTLDSAILTLHSPHSPFLSPPSLLHSPLPSHHLFLITHSPLSSLSTLLSSPSTPLSSPLLSPIIRYSYCLSA